MNRGTNSFHEPLHADLVPVFALVSRLALVSISAAQGLLQQDAYQSAVESSS